MRREPFRVPSRTCANCQHRDRDAASEPCRPCVTDPAKLAFERAAPADQKGA